LRMKSSLLYRYAFNVHNRWHSQALPPAYIKPEEGNCFKKKGDQVRKKKEGCSGTVKAMLKEAVSTEA
ncbi:MAG: hypothetical protein WA946_11455, partial [Nitrospirota bacterium]